MDGNDIQWYYNSIGYDKDYQFRVYDMNMVHITADKFAPNSNDADISKYVGEYAKPNNTNEVLINVWGYEPKWEIEKEEEEGELLDVERIATKDPLQMISLTVKLLNNGDKNPSSALTARSSDHFFKVNGSNPPQHSKLK